MRFWSPIVAGEDERTSMPVAFFDVELANPTAKAIDALGDVHVPERHVARHRHDHAPASTADSNGPFGGQRRDAGLGRSDEHTRRAQVGVDHRRTAGERTRS